MHPKLIFVKDFRVPRTFRQDHVMKEFRAGVTKVLFSSVSICFDSMDFTCGVHARVSIL